MKILAVNEKLGLSREYLSAKELKRYLEKRKARAYDLTRNICRFVSPGLLVVIR